MSDAPDIEAASGWIVDRPHSGQRALMAQMCINHANAAQVNIAIRQLKKGVAAPPPNEVRGRTSGTATQTAPMLRRTRGTSK
jgi:hypothetical protein